MTIPLEFIQVNADLQDANIYQLVELMKIRQKEFSLAWYFIDLYA